MVQNNQIFKLPNNTTTPTAAKTTTSGPKAKKVGAANAEAQSKTRELKTCAAEETIDVNAFWAGKDDDKVDVNSNVDVEEDADESFIGSFRSPEVMRLFDTGKDRGGGNGDGVREGVDARADERGSLRANPRMRTGTRTFISTGENWRGWRVSLKV